MALHFHPFGRKPAFSRSATRHACQIEGEIVLTEKMASYEGRIVNLSIGGAMFRPRLAYLMHRRGVAIVIQAGGLSLGGEIVTTTPEGFGIRFNEPLGDAAMEHLLARSAVVESAPA